MDDQEVNAHRIAALEASVAELRGIITVNFERMSGKMDMLLELKLRHERTWEDLQRAWEAIHNLENIIAVARELPGMKVTLYGQDGQGGVVARVIDHDSRLREVSKAISVNLETEDDRLDAIEQTLEGTSEKPGLVDRVAAIEERTRQHRWALVAAGGMISAALMWVMSNLAGKLKALLFGP